MSVTSVSFEIAEFWCAECAEDALFELVPTDTRAREYACTACGTAYMEVLIAPVTTAGRTRGVA